MKSIEDQIKEKEARRQEIFKIKEPLDKELSELYIQIQKLKEKQTGEKLREDMTLAEKVEWLLFEDCRNYDMKRYKECQNFFQEMEEDAAQSVLRGFMGDTHSFTIEDDIGCSSICISNEEE